MNKVLLIVVAFLITINIQTKADEGMWLPIFLKRLNYADMQKKGCKLTPEEIYSINKSSLKDYYCQNEVILHGLYSIKLTFF